MKRHIFKCVVIFSLFTTQVFGQTNLICNPSFETIDEEVFDKLNVGEAFYPSHFPIESNEYPGLFTCWKWGPGEGGMGTSLPNADGLCLGIIPGLFPVINHDPGTWETSSSIPGLQSEEPDYSQEPPVIFYSPTDDASRLTFIASPQTPSEYGLDLSPPDTKFGNGVSAVDGSNYVALFDFENHLHAKPFLYTDLKYALVKDVEYTFTMWFAKMNRIGEVKVEDQWDDVKNGKIKVYVCDENFNHKQKIAEIEVTSNDWNYNEGQVNFVADRSSTRLYIEYNPLTENGWLETHYVSKISGVFIDHLKLYEACETPVNQCENANYKRDLLDLDIEKVEMQSPYAFPYNSSFNEGFLKTIRVYHLENAKHLYVKISPHNSSTACYELDLWYPPSDWFWDGNDYNGNPVSDDVDYDIEVTVFNDCFVASKDKNGFPLNRKYSVFNTWTSTSNDDGNTFINGLDNVHWINVKMHTLSGALVHEFSLNNPPSSLGLSLQSLETYGGAQNGEVAPAYYNLTVTVLNNCKEMQYKFTNAHVGVLVDGGTPSPFYNWSPVPKPAEFDCPFDFHYNQFVRSPMNCCEGYLHLENMEIWNSWGEVNIQDSILIGPNVVFEPGTYNYLNAGEQIVFLPDSSGVTVLGTGVFKPNTFECVICKNYTFESLPDDEEGDNEREIVYTNIDSLAQMRSVDMLVYPNPSPGDQEITVLAGSTDIDPRKYKLVLSDPLGKPVEIKVTTERTDMLRFRPASPPSPGAYYLYYESNGEQETFSVVIR